MRLIGAAIAAVMSFALEGWGGLTAQADMQPGDKSPAVGIVCESSHDAGYALQIVNALRLDIDPIGAEVVKRAGLACQFIDAMMEYLGPVPGVVTYTTGDAGADAFELVALRTMAGRTVYSWRQSEIPGEDA